MGLLGIVVKKTVEMIISGVLLVAAHKYFNKNHEATDPVTTIARRFGRPPFVTNSYEDKIAGGVIDPDDIKVDFNSIGGLTDIKKALMDSVILPLTRPDLFAHGKLLGPQKGVLLYGPPGTGKTMIAKAIAKQAGAVFINVRVSELMSKWFGEAPKLVTAVFTLANKLQPAIIFIDEVDSFLGQRSNSDHEVMTNMKTEFMSMWDGFTTDQNGTVMVLAATNRPEVLDEAILRRFSESFEIGLPNRKERASILQIILKDENVENVVDYDYLAGLCEGCAGSDLSKLCKDTALLLLGEYLEAVNRGDSPPGLRPMAQSDFEKVFRSSKSTKTAAEAYSHRASKSSSSSSRR
ncbi:uncharacterized protein LOC141656755 isoform X1 [Silene latifolia]|uniref:uncharacterized protein LOC141656755 isoform X1 n=1 Tax=Silene latifolia TaxID=37657 RepID=UPI003D780323